MHWRRHATGWAFTAPALAILAAFLLYPIGYSLWLSLHEWDGYTPRWGALHLAWGRVLEAEGKRDEARKKYRAARSMDLSAADRAEVARRLTGR